MMASMVRNLRKSSTVSACPLSVVAVPRPPSHSSAPPLPPPIPLFPALSSCQAFDKMWRESGLAQGISRKRRANAGVPAKTVYEIPAGQWEDLDGGPGGPGANGGGYVAGGGRGGGGSGAGTPRGGGSGGGGPARSGGGGVGGMGGHKRARSNLSGGTAGGAAAARAAAAHHAQPRGARPMSDEETREVGRRLEQVFADANPVYDPLRSDIMALLERVPGALVDNEVEFDALPDVAKWGLWDLMSAGFPQ